jgi:hypothetical protein
MDCSCLLPEWELNDARLLCWIDGLEVRGCWLCQGIGLEELGNGSEADVFKPWPGECLIMEGLVDGFFS